MDQQVTEMGTGILIGILIMGIFALIIMRLFSRR